MKILTLDTETTCLKIHPKKLNGNPFSEKNTLVCVGLLEDDGTYHHFWIEKDSQPFGEALKQIQEIIDVHDVLVGFNLKFDLHWLFRYGMDFKTKRMYDCQLAEFILSNQSNAFPSLQTTAVNYGLEGKLDVVKTDFWDKGIDTDEIPSGILEEYLKQDVEQTKQVYLCQKKVTPSRKLRLISLQNQDLLSLLEIEKNGMLYDVQTSKKKGDEVQKELNEITKNLVSIIGFEHFNPGSGDHVSAILYGGSVFVPFREQYTFTYKDGRTAIKERWADKEYIFPRLVTPIKGSELKKEGFFSTNADTLRSLKCKGKANQLIELILKQAELEKLRGTYLHGLPELIEENAWEKDTIHGQMNQCIAVTGRLSSSKPNLQNFDKSLGYLFRSRYE